MFGKNNVGKEMMGISNFYDKKGLQMPRYGVLDGLVMIRIKTINDRRLRGRWVI